MLSSKQPTHYSLLKYNETKSLNYVIKCIASIIMITFIAVVIIYATTTQTFVTDNIEQINHDRNVLTSPSSSPTMHPTTAEIPCSGDIKLMITLWSPIHPELSLIGGGTEAVAECVSSGDQFDVKKIPDFPYLLFGNFRVFWGGRGGLVKKIDNWFDGKGYQRKGEVDAVDHPVGKKILQGFVADYIVINYERKSTTQTFVTDNVEQINYDRNVLTSPSSSPTMHPKTAEIPCSGDIKLMITLWSPIHPELSLIGGGTEAVAECVSSGDQFDVKKIPDFPYLLFGNFRVFWGGRGGLVKKIDNWFDTKGYQRKGEVDAIDHPVGKKIAQAFVFDKIVINYERKS